jgi:hypothetical protein
MVAGTSRWCKMLLLLGRLHGSFQVKHLADVMFDSTSQDNGGLSMLSKCLALLSTVEIYFCAYSLALVLKAASCYTFTCVQAALGSSWVRRICSLQYSQPTAAPSASTEPQGSRARVYRCT